jgi:hypothetical protein
MINHAHDVSDLEGLKTLSKIVWDMGPWYGEA